MPFRGVGSRFSRRRCVRTQIWRSTGSGPPAQRAVRSSRQRRRPSNGSTIALRYRRSARRDPGAPVRRIPAHGVEYRICWDANAVMPPLTGVPGASDTRRVYAIDDEDTTIGAPFRRSPSRRMAIGNQGIRVKICYVPAILVKSRPAPRPDHDRGPD